MNINQGFHQGTYKIPMFALKQKRIFYTPYTTKHNKRFLQNQTYTSKSQCIKYDLLQNLKRAKVENLIETRSKHYTTYTLLIIDEIVN